MARKTPPQPEATPTQFRNISPLGALDVPAVGRIIQPDEVFFAPEGVATMLIHQPEHFAPADGEPLGEVGGTVDVGRERVTRDQDGQPAGRPRGGAGRGVSRRRVVGSAGFRGRRGRCHGSWRPSRAR